MAYRLFLLFASIFSIHSESGDCQSGRHLQKGQHAPGGMNYSKIKKDFWMVETETGSEFLVSFEMNCSAGPGHEEVSSCSIDPSLNKQHDMQINEYASPGSTNFGKEAKAKIQVKSGAPAQIFTATNIKISRPEDMHIREYSITCDSKRGATVCSLSFDLFPAVKQSMFKKFHTVDFAAEMCASIDKQGSKVEVSLPGIRRSTVTVAFLVKCGVAFEKILSCSYEDAESRKMQVKADTPAQVSSFRSGITNGVKLFEFECDSYKGPTITPVDKKKPLAVMGGSGRAASALCTAGRKQSPIRWHISIDGEDLIIPIVFTLDCAAGKEQVLSCKYDKVEVTPANDPKIISYRPSRKYKLGCDKQSGATVKSSRVKLS